MFINHCCDYTPNYLNNGYELNILYQYYQKKKFSIILGALILFSIICVDFLIDSYTRIKFFIKNTLFKVSKLYEYIINIFMHINYSTQGPISNYRILYKRKRDKWFAFQEKKTHRIIFLEAFQNFEINPHYFLDFFDTKKYFYTELEFGATKFIRTKTIRTTKLYKTKVIKFKVYVKKDKSSKFKINKNLLINTVLTTKNMSFRNFLCYLDSYRTIMVNYKYKFQYKPYKLRRVKKRVLPGRKRLIFWTSDFMYYSHLFYTRFDKRMMDFLFSNKPCYKRRQLDLIHGWTWHKPRNNTFFNRSIYRREYYRPHISLRHIYMYDQDGYKSQLFLYGVLLMLIFDVLLLDLFYLKTFELSVSNNFIPLMQNFYILGAIALIVCFFYHMQNRYYYRWKIKRYIKNKWYINYKWRWNFWVPKIENDKLFHQYNKEWPVTVNMMLNNDYYVPNVWPLGQGIVNDKYFFHIKYWFHSYYNEQIWYVLATNLHPSMYIYKIFDIWLLMYKHYKVVKKWQKRFSEVIPGAMQPMLIKRHARKFPVGRVFWHWPFGRAKIFDCEWPMHLDLPSYRKVRRRVRITRTKQNTSFWYFYRFTRKNLNKYTSHKWQHYAYWTPEPLNDRRHKTTGYYEFWSKCQFFNVRRTYIRNPDYEM